MNRISRLTTDITRADFALTHQQQLLQLLTQHFPAKYRVLFATPEKNRMMSLNGILLFQVTLLPWPPYKAKNNKK